MIYGLVFLEHKNISAQDQRSGILKFAKQHKLPIDDFISFNKNPNMLKVNSGDTIVCYEWSCLCKETSFWRLFVQYLIKNEVYLYSATSKYCIDKHMDLKAFHYAIMLYEDIRVNFWSNKTRESAKKRLVSGRQVGSKNKTHILDGKDKVIWGMYSRGVSMYAIAKKMKVSAPTIKRFLTKQN